MIPSSRFEPSIVQTATSQPTIDEGPCFASTPPSTFAQALSGNAILLEIGATLGVLDPLLHGEVCVEETGRSCGVNPSFLSAYYAALVHAGLAYDSSPARGGGTHYRGAESLERLINDTGYVLWGLISCGPLIANAKFFVGDLPSAARVHRRNGEHVARTSKWMGESDFYPQAERAIIASRPCKIVDLGAGTCGLLLRCLSKLPESTGVGIEINADACSRARSVIAGAGMADRLLVVEAPIQNLIHDPSPVVGADVIHAGFVFHDLSMDEKDALLSTFRRIVPKATLIIVDAIPYASDPAERAFSAAFTFLHSHFMGRRLLSESEWAAKLSHAGYNTVGIEQLRISGGRIITAKCG